MKKKYLQSMAMLLVVLLLAAFTAVGCDTGEEPVAEVEGETEAPTDGGEDAAADEVTDGEKEVLLMGTNADFPPFEFIDDNNEIAGFDVDLAREIANNLGMELQIENMDFDGLIPAVVSGMVDIAVAAMTIREDRLENVNFSTPYFDAGQVIVVNAGYDAISSEADLTDKRIAAQLGTTGQFALEDLEIPMDQITLFPKVTEVFMELKQEKVDAVVIDRPVADRYIQVHEGLVIVGDNFTEEVFGIAVPKDNPELLEKINAALAELQESGKYDEIFDKWF